MSEELNNIDQLIGNGATQMDFEFKPAYWSEMETLLNAQSKKKIAAWLFFSVACFALFVLLSGLMYHFNNQTAYKYTSIFKRRERIKMQANTQIEFAQIKKTLVNAKPAYLQNSKQNNRTELHNENSKNIPLTNDGENNGAKKESDKTLNRIRTSALSLKKNKVLTAPDINQSFSQRIIAKKEVKKNTPVADKTSFQVDNMNVPNIALMQANKQLLLPIKIKRSKPRFAHTFLAEFGMGYGANSLSSSRFGGEKIHLGLVYQLQKANWGLKTGIHASWNSVEGLNYLKRQKIYGFSSNFVSSQLNYRALVNLNIPAEVIYTFQNNTFGAGLQLNVLMATTSKVRNWTENNMSSKYEWNYSNNLKPITVSAVIDYTYQFNNRWRLGAAFSYMLTPIASNNEKVFRNKQFKLFSGQIFVQYDLKIFH